MEEAYRAALACLPGMNVLSLPRLLQLAGGAERLWDIVAKGGERAAALVGWDRAGVWSDASIRVDPHAVLKDLESRGISTLVPESRGFPERLRAIYDPPALLFVRGEEPPADVPFVAVVGSRKASSYGKWAAETIGGELARRGIVVVSGAAYGVDGHAHAGCLKAGGFTAAVLGCGIDVAYPSEHAGLLQRIASSGCVLSEYPPGDEPLPWRFPHRNRIIAGLSHAVVVVEASRKSGALITADLALEEGREVMAVPGPIGSPLSQGTNGLIQKGAKLIMNAEDICDELPPEFARVATSGKGTWPGNARGGEVIDPLERKCLALLQGETRGLDSLANMTGIAPHELLACLTAMSIKGWIGTEAGGRYRLLINPIVHKQ
jgi:DNA processing protein